MKKDFNQLSELMKNWSGSLLDLCFELYQIIEEEKTENRVMVFSYICRHIDDYKVDYDEETTIISPDTLNRYKNTYGKYIDESINISRIKADHDSNCDFYACLWDSVFVNGFISEDSEKAFALYWILIDRSIPYVPTEEPLKISQKEIENILTDSKEVIEKIYYIFSLPFETRTETASLLLKELLSLDSFNQQVVLFVKILNISAEYENRSFNKMLEIFKRINSANDED